jgi:triacylglycerol lipase
MRGARGIDIDLPSLNSFNLGIPKPTSNEWSIMDWTRFLNAWKREEHLERDANRRTTTLSSSSADTRYPTPQDLSNANQDAVVKASTEQLSTVFDWLIDQLPTSVKSVSVNVPIKAPESVLEAANGLMKQTRAKVEQREAAKMKANNISKKNELETKEDLEKFYVTLSRKLYNEGF